MIRLFSILLALCALPAHAGERTVHATLVVFSDIYEISERDGRGGFARVAAAVAGERARARNAVVAMAGDMISPSILSGFDQGAHMVDLLNRMKVDFFTPGNHEYDFGEDIFRQRMSELHTTRLAANLRDASGDVLQGFEDNKIVDIDGVKFGFFGLTEDDSAHRSNTGGLRIAPAISTARTQTRKLRDAGADIIVAVTHSDWQEDQEIARLGSIDILLSGHDHKLFVAYDGRAAIAETQADGKEVVSVDLAITVADQPVRRVTWTPRFRIVDTADVKPDHEVAERVAHYLARMDKGLDEPIGVTRTLLDFRASSLRSEETALGDFYADAMRERVGADIAIMNGGGIRGDAVIEAGATISGATIVASLPFRNRLANIELSGADIRAGLENGVSLLSKRAGRFPQISGARMVVRREAPEGARIVSIEIDGKPIDDKKRYKVATNDYLAEGKDGYDAFVRGTPLLSEDDGPLLATVVMDAIRKTGSIAPKPDGRIRID